jgi:FKBP-type peptidyl-prolyl cis-trans isomerase SlyD
MKVETNMVVSLRFVMKNRAGEIMEDIMECEPVQYLHGSGSILPPLENGIEGLRENDTKHLDFTIEGGGIYSMDVVIDNIRPATAEELTTGKPMEKTPDAACGPGCCC